MSLFAPFLLVLLASSFASCGHWLRGDQLFYSHPPKMSYADSLKDCHSLGAQLPSNYTIEDIQLLQSFGHESGETNWLDAERTTSGYRWRLSGQLIDPEMWASGYPNCSHSCAVFLRRNDGMLGDYVAAGHSNPLCVFNISNEATVTNLLSKWSLVNDADRAGLLVTIIKYAQEKRIVHEHSISQQLSDDLHKLESSLFQETSILRGERLTGNHGIEKKIELLSNHLLERESNLSRKYNFNLLAIIVFIITAAIVFALMHIRITRVHRSLRDRESKRMDAVAREPIYMSSLLNTDLKEPFYHVPACLPK